VGDQEKSPAVPTSPKKGMGSHQENADQGEVKQTRKKKEGTIS